MAVWAGRAGALTRRDALTRLLVSSWGLIVACRQDVRPGEVRGVVTDVRISSFTQIQGFSLRTDDGTAYEFIVEGNVGITPGHLREHMLLGDPVVVAIRYDDGLVIATHVDDAIPATPTQ